MLITNYLWSEQKKKISYILNKQFHLVDPSTWPFLGALSVYLLALNSTLLMHNCINFFFISIILLTNIMTWWWFDVITEGTLQGKHTLQVQIVLKIGMILFIISEIMFFFFFFVIVVRVNVNDPKDFPII
jgi:cytochrome c oxidase subunit 3